MLGTGYFQEPIKFDGLLMRHSIFGLFGGSVQVISHGWNAYVRVSTVIHEKEKVNQILFSPQKCY